jgi:hypothetical protein
MMGGLTERGVQMHWRHGPQRGRLHCACCGISEVTRPVSSFWTNVLVSEPKPRGPDVIVTCGSVYCRAVAARGEVRYP